MLAYSIRIVMQAVVVSGFYGVPSGHCKPSNFHQQSTRIIYNFKVYILVGHRDETLKITIYTGDVDTTPEQILIKAKNTFNISVDEKKLDFVFLKRRKWIEAQQYPYFTLLGQSLGSLALGLEALFKHQPGTSTACFGILFDNIVTYPFLTFIPDIYIDTMGYAFTLPLFKYFGKCMVGCYVHYPTISTDMLRRVKSRINAHNNRSLVAKNPFLTWLKLLYYRIFAKVSS